MDHSHCPIFDILHFIPCLKEGFFMLHGVRGAVTVAENEASAIHHALKQLLETLLYKNQITVGRIASVFFTVTPDLTAINPARAARETMSDWKNVPMLCSQEPMVEGMLPKCIRILIQWHADQPDFHPTPVYLGETQQLRPDLSP
jgi:chorismate mutase